MNVLLTEPVIKTISAVAKGKTANPARAKKIAKTIKHLETNPTDHPGLHSHRYDSLDDAFGEKVWESYVENDTHGAWRIWWYFGPNEGDLTVVDLGPHP